MKKLVMISLFATFALACAAQNGSKTLEEQLQVKLKRPTVPLAHKPMVLYTGKPLLPSEKRELMKQFNLSTGARSATINSSASLNNGAPKKPSANSPANPTVTPGAMSTTGLNAVGKGIAIWDQQTNAMVFQPAPTGTILLFANVTPNSTNLINIQVQVCSSTQFTIDYTSPAAGKQTVNVDNGGGCQTTPFEFAIAFDATGSGNAEFAISANQQWYFDSAVLTTVQQ